MGSVTTGEQGEPARDPWQRFGWLMGVVWIVFLFFPISSVIESEASAGAKVAAVALLAAFGVVYIAGFVARPNFDSWEESRARGLITIGILLALMISAALLTDVGALGATAFVVATAMFSGSLRFALALALTLTAALVVVLVITGDISRGLWLILPPLIVIVTTGVTRALIEAGVRHDEMDRQLGLVAERERVARDVHDTLGHSLTIVTVKAELAERLIDRDPDAARREIAQIRSLSREALAEVRATVSGLRVARLGDEIDSACRALEGAGIAHEVRGAADDVDPRYRIIVAWTLREAITNVVRHARARRCTVTLTADGLVVEDDGVGIADADAVAGLRGVRERAAGAGATLTVGRADRDQGTRVEVRW